MQTEIYLIDYLEGGLEKENEAELFKALSESEELRAKMNILLRTKEISRKYLSHVIVPASATNKLFAELGMSDAFSESIPEPETIPVQKKNRKMYFILPALFAASLLGFIAGYFISERNNTEFKSIDLKNKNISVQNDFSDLNKDSMRNESHFAQNNIQEKKRIIPKVNQYISDKNGKNLTHPNKDVREIVYSEEQTEQVKKLNFSKSEIVIIEFNIAINSDKNLLSGMSYFYANESEFQTEESSQVTRFLIETGRADYMKLNDKSGQKMELPMMNNTGLSIAYYLSDNFAVGMEYKIESFSGTVFDNYNYISVNKKSTGETKAVFFRFENNSEEINPYGQFTVGAFDDGAVIKLATGAKYSISNKFSVYLGLEYSGYINTYYDDLSNFQKLGINYGISYNY